MARTIIVCVVGLAMASPGSNASAQYIRNTVPFNTNNESYFERIGVDFGFRLNGSAPNGNGVVGLNPDGSFTSDGNIRFTQNGVGSAVPPFGGFDPNTQAHIGWGTVGPNGEGYQLGLFASQGNSRSSTVQAPTLVTPNGIPGSVQDTINRPFVTGLIPVVGNFDPRIMSPPVQYVSPIELALRQLQAEGRLTKNRDGTLTLVGADKESEVSTSSGGGYSSAPDSSATRGDISVAEIRAQREARREAVDAETAAKIAELISSAENCIEKRRPGSARIFIRSAIKLAEGEQREELIKWYESLKQ